MVNGRNISLFSILLKGICTWIMNILAAYAADLPSADP